MHPAKLAGLLLYSAFVPGDGSTIIDMKRNSPAYQALSVKDKFLVAISWNYYNKGTRQLNNTSGFRGFILRFFLGKEASGKLNVIKRMLPDSNKPGVASTALKRYASYLTPYYQNFTLSPQLLNEWDKDKAPDTDSYKDDSYTYDSDTYDSDTYDSDNDDSDNDDSNTKDKKPVRTQTHNKRTSQHAPKTPQQIADDAIFPHWSTRFNPFALLNPLNYWRAIDTIPSTIALWCYAISDLVSEKRPKTSWAFYFAGHFFSLITAAIRWPRVGLQFMIGLSVRPLWHCIRRVVNQDNPGTITWALAIILTAVNLILLGLPNAVFTLVNFFAILITDAPLKSATFLQELGFGYMNNIGSNVVNPDNVDLVVNQVLEPVYDVVGQATGNVFGSPLNFAATGTNTATVSEITTTIGDGIVAVGMNEATTTPVRTLIVHNFNNYKNQGNKSSFSDTNLIKNAIHLRY